MFFSVSNAISNTTVRTQFIATESCTVVIPASPNQGVTLNGVTSSDTSFQLIQGDEISLDYLAPPEGEVVLYEWSYNGNTCFFAITSRNNQTNRTIRNSFNDSAWWEFSNPSSDITYQGVNFDGILNYSIEVDELADLPLPNGREDIVAFLEPPRNRIVFFYNVDGQTNGLLSIPNNFHTLDLPSRPRSMARLLNNSNQRYEIYVLCEDGFIYRIDHQFQITQSTVSHPNTAWVIISDDLNLWIAGDQYLVRMSDMDTVSQIIPSSEFITAGAALGPLVMFSAKGGKTLRVSGNQISIGHSGSWKGIPVAANDRIWFPDPTNNRVMGYSSRTASIASFQTIGSISSLPWASGSNGQDLVISYLDETSVGFLPDGSSFAVPRNLSEQTMFIGCSDNWIVGSSYLADLRFTNVNSPQISGPAFGYREATGIADIGSGDFQVSSENEFTPVRIAPNTQAVIDGQIFNESSTVINTTIPDGSYIGISVRSNLEKKSSVVVIGTQAFDYVVRGVETTSKTSNIDPGVQIVSPVSSFSFTVPTIVSNAPISVSYGTLQINGQTHNGTSRVNGGDAVVVTLRLRENLPNRSTILSLADAQFALLANGRPEVELSVVDGVAIGSTEVTSQVTITETGTYHIPRYSRHVSIIRNGFTLFPSSNPGPITLIQNDVVSINHVKASQILSDVRRTYIIGPNSNFYVESSSFVDDEPNTVDFGIIALLQGIPDFPALAPNLVTISGLSPLVSVRIFSDDPNISFSVNDGEFETRPEVRNGDTVRAQYIVRNLFESKSVFTERSDGSSFLLGSIGIESPTNTILVQYEQSRSPISQWIRYLLSDFSYQNNAVFNSVLNILPTESPTGLLVSFDQMKSDAPLADFAGFDQMSTPAPLSNSFTSYSILESLEMLDDFEVYDPSSHSDRTMLDRFESFEDEELLEFQGESSHQSLIQLSAYDPIVENLSAYQLNSHTREWESLPHEIHRYFLPTFEFTSEVVSKFFSPTWYRLNENQKYLFSPNWENLPPNRPIEEFVIVFTALKDVFSILFVDTLYQYNIGPKLLDITPISTIGNPIGISEFPIRSGFTEGQSLKDISIQGHVASDRLWDTTLPLLTGGFVDEITASLAGQFAASDFSFETYQQPEGSWSFIVNKESSLVCEARPTTLRAVAWLLGGG